MTDKQPTPQEQAQVDQQKLEAFLKENKMGITLLFVSQNNSLVWLVDAIKDEYKTWQAQIKVTND